MSSDPVRNADSGTAFRSEDEKRALLLRMGTGSAAWAYLDTLARAARMSRDVLEPKLEALEHEGLVTSRKVPAGVRYRLTDEGRHFRGGTASRRWRRFSTMPSESGADS